MKILYVMPGDVANGPLGMAEIKRRETILNGWAGAGMTVQVADSPGGPLSIESTAEEYLCIGPMMSTIACQGLHPDAVIIGCFGDPGLAGLREVLDCPVVGPLEASFHLAGQLGRRVGIVTVIGEVLPMLDQLIAGMKLSEKYVGATTVDVPVLELGQEAALCSRVKTAAVNLIEKKEADVLILGCMSMAFLEVAEALEQDLGIPLINPAKCALKTAELMLSLGARQSRRSYPKPRKDIVQLLRRSTPVSTARDS